MSDLQAKGSPQRKEKVGPADLAFVAFIVIITAIRRDAYADSNLSSKS